MIAIDPSKPKGIVWLASYPRSGNTWLRIFLDRLIHVLEGREVDEEDFARRIRFALTDSDIGLYKGWLEPPASNVSPMDLAKARLPALASIVEHSPGIVPLKTHYANIAMYDVRFMAPEISAGAIYVVRNPLDVAISFAHFNSSPIDESIAIMGKSGCVTPPGENILFELRGSWSEHVSTWTTDHDDSLLVVRYEDMLEKPLEAFAAIAKHTRMTCTNAQLQKAIDLTSFGQLREREARSGFVEKPESVGRFFREGKSGQWQDVLTNEQVERIIADHGVQMRRMGYLD